MVCAMVSGMEIAKIGRCEEIISSFTNDEGIVEIIKCNKSGVLIKETIPEIGVEIVRYLCSQHVGRGNR